MNRLQSRVVRVASAVARSQAGRRNLSSALTSARLAFSPVGTTLRVKSTLHTHGSVRFASHAPAATHGIVQFKLADVGEGIAECEILKWHVKVGDTVKEFDPLCEVQSDKATVEITSRYDGVVTKLYHEQGNMAKVGQPLVDIDLGPSKDGAKDHHAPAHQAHHAPAPAPAHAEAGHAKGEEASSHGHIMATPAVRHLLKTLKIDANKVHGTGRDGRILKEDILAYQQKHAGHAAPSLTSSHAPSHAPSHTPSAPSHHAPQSSQASSSVAAGSQKPREQKQALTGIKRVMARTMTAATAVPHFGYADDFTMDALTHLRNQLKPVAEGKGIKLTYMPFFIKAASLALLRYPTLNSSLNSDMTELTIKNYHNIGVAMDTPQGLVVPNIKDVQDKSVYDIAKEMQRLHSAAVSNQLSPADMTGGTFTLSNIGTIGGTYTSPVLVLPEVVIGAIGKIQKVPRFDSKGNVIPVHILQISWSADHRVIDGATMAHFSNLMKLYLEKPETMLAEMR